MTWLWSRRLLSSASGEMRAWTVDFPGGPLQLKPTSIPVIRRPSEVLIKVKASSVNPVDTVMVNGYGNHLLTQWKQLEKCNFEEKRFPLIPGRDCSGTIESVGGAVHNLAKGDKVMAVVPAIAQGCHAEYVVTDASSCSVIPPNLDFVQAASLPYVGCTAWAALVSVARINPNRKPAERVLIHGGSGGLGTIAIQMLKAWGVEKVVVTCSKDSFPLVESLGAIPIDYRAEDATSQLIDHAPFEVVLDCVDSELAKWSDKVMGVWRNSVHVSVVSPLLRDTDSFGTIPGLASTAYKHFQRSWDSALRGRWFSYAFFMPSRECMQQLSRFAFEEKIKPIVEKTFDFEQLPEAYEKVAQLCGRGKTVLKF